MNFRETKRHSPRPQLSLPPVRGQFFRFSNLVLIAVVGLLSAVPQTAARAQFPLRNFPGLKQSKSPYEPLREQGFDHYQKREYKKAIQVATEVIQGEPNHPVAYYLRASARIELGRVAGDKQQVRAGIEDVRKALGIRGGDEKFASLYIPYLYGMSSLAIIEGKTSYAETAIKVAGPIIERPQVSRSDKTNLLYQRAFAYEQANLVDAAQIGRTTPSAEARQVFQKKQEERRDAAIRDYTRAISLNPKHIGAHINRAKAFAAGGYKEQALAAFAAAIQEFPRNPLVYNDRGTYYRQQGDLDNAIADFTLAIESQYNFAMGYINRGFCLVDKGEDQAAEADFSMAISHAPQMSLPYSLRGTARMSQGKTEQAIADFTHQIELNSQDTTAYANRGFARYFAGQYAPANQDFQTAMKLQPRALHLGAWRYLSLEREGQTAPAKTELEQFLESESGPKGWVAQVCKYLLGKASEEEFLKAAQSSDKRIGAAQLCEAQYFIGQRKTIGGDSEAAREHFQAALKTEARYLSAYRGARYELGDFTEK